MDPLIILVIVIFVILIVGLIIWAIIQASRRHNLNTIPFSSLLNGQSEVPPNSSTATGLGKYLLNQERTTFTYDVTFTGLASPFLSAHFHQGAVGVSGPIVRTLTSSFTPSNVTRTAGRLVGTWSVSDSESLTPERVNQLENGQIYINVHSQNLPDGEIRGQVNKLLK
jgi:cytoskeletal protein RodZ